jgi:transglutaminase-like putative cysteine protease
MSERWTQRGVLHQSERRWFKVVTGLVTLLVTLTFAEATTWAAVAKGRREAREQAQQAARKGGFDVRMASEPMRLQAELARGHEERRSRAVAELRGRLGPKAEKLSALRAQVERLDGGSSVAALEALPAQLEALGSDLAAGRASRERVEAVAKLVDEARAGLDSPKDRPLRRKLDAVRGALTKLQGTARLGSRVPASALVALLGEVKDAPRTEAPRGRFKAQSRMGARELWKEGALSPELKALYAGVSEEAWIESPWGERFPLPQDDGEAVAFFEPPDPLALREGLLASADPLEVMGTVALGALAPPTPEDLASTVDAPLTPEIQALAERLARDPRKLFNYVHDGFGVELYYGAKKGAVGALMEGAGNDFDLASLLVALLRASGVPARYEYATVALSPSQVMEATGFDTPEAAVEGFATVGYPVTAVAGADGKLAAVKLERAFVRAHVAYGNYRGTGPRTGNKLWVRLDPALKLTATPRTADFRGLVEFDYASYLGSLTNQSPRERYEERLLAAAKARNLCDTLEKGLWQALPVPQELELLPADHPGRVDSTLLVFSTVPESLRYAVEIGVGSGAAKRFAMPELYGKRLALRFPGASAADEQAIEAAGGLVNVRPYQVNVAPSLRLEGTEAARFGAVMPGTKVAVDVKVTGPRISAIPLGHHVTSGGVYALSVTPGVTSEEVEKRREQELSSLGAGAAEDELDEARAHLNLARYARQVVTGA